MERVSGTQPGSSRAKAPNRATGYLLGTWLFRVASSLVVADGSHPEGLLHQPDRNCTIPSQFAIRYLLAVLLIAGLLMDV